MLTPESLMDFRKISLINSSLKILSKLLASTLSSVMNCLVDNAQSTFLKGRCIMNNIATIEELLFSIQNCHLRGHIMKVDFTQAFDTVDWDFLIDLLEARDFLKRWVG